MDETKFLAEAFEADRKRLARVAYRMLGSVAEAEDAVQEAWIRLSRSGIEEIGNLNGWLTTVVARVCLDILRTRRSRREDPLDTNVEERSDGHDPETDLAMADSVGFAMLVVLETLPPHERIAFVLHDMFDLPFDEIAPIVGKSAVATRRLASRARRRVKGGAELQPDVQRQREVVGAYIEAARSGNLAAMLAVLAPEVTVSVDGVYSGRGADLVAGRAIAGRSPSSGIALLDGAPGIVMVEAGHLLRALRFTFAGRRITEVDVITDPSALAAMVVEVLE